VPSSCSSAAPPPWDSSSHPSPPRPVLDVPAVSLFLRSHSNWTRYETLCMSPRSKVLVKGILSRRRDAKSRHTWSIFYLDRMSFLLRILAE
jgi:hypothetical protein